LRVRGTRISVEQVLELLEAGVVPADIIKSFPSLNLPSVIAVERLAAQVRVGNAAGMHILLDENVPVDSTAKDGSLIRFGGQVKTI